MAAFDFAKVKDPTFFKENVLTARSEEHTSELQSQGTSRMPSSA